MDALRRQALQKGVGAIGAALVGGRAMGALNRTQEASASRWAIRDPINAGFGMGEAGVPSLDPDYEWRARSEASKPIQKKIDEIVSRHDYNNVVWPAHLHALKSPSQYWKHQTARDYTLRQRTIIDALQAEINSIFSSPIDKMNETMRNGIFALMDELKKAATP